MLNAEKNCLPGDSIACETTSAARNAAFRFLHEFSAETLKDTLLLDRHLSKPVEELMATAEAAFVLIRNSEMDIELKNAFYRLEVQFEFYRNLAMRQFLN
jgi:hypothetical protein